MLIPNFTTEYEEMLQILLPAEKQKKPEIIDFRLFR
jgi:hypothetical protein